LTPVSSALAHHKVHTNNIFPSQNPIAKMRTNQFIKEVGAFAATLVAVWFIQQQSKTNAIVAAALTSTKKSPLSRYVSLIFTSPHLVFINNYETIPHTSAKRFRD